MRCLLIEAAKDICKGAIGHKSKELRARQSGQPAEIIAYADRANTWLRSKYYKMIRVRYCRKTQRTETLSGPQTERVVYVYRKT